MKRVLKTFFLTLLLVMSTFSYAFAEGEAMEYLVLGQTHTITLTGYDYETYSYDSKTYYFTPTATGTYILNATATGEVWGYLDLVDTTTGQEFYVGSNCSNSIDYSMTMTYELTAGQTYAYTFQNNEYYPIDVTFMLTLDCSDLITWNESSYIIAKDITTTLPFTDPTRISAVQWTSSDPTIASVDAMGNIVGISTGEVTITATITDIYGGTATGTAHYTITDPVLDKSVIGLNIYNAWEMEDGSYSCDNNSITLSGICDDSTIQLTSSSENLLCNEPSIWYGETSATLYLYPKKTGNYTITLIVDGKTMTISVDVRKLYFKRHKRSICDESMKTWCSNSMIVMAKGETVTLTIKGVKSTDTVKYVTDDKKVATVSKSGKIKAKGLGETNITATVGDVVLTYRVGVTSKKAVTALLYARKHFDSTYSQAKRMQDGYYDCSSFVWRSYASGKTYVGPNKNWAPTAADMAKWCVENGYMIYSGTVDTSKLLPGDLVFETGANNGRFMGIYHVDMYQGNATCVTVARNKYFGWQMGNVMIARPTNNNVTGLKVKKASGGLKLTWSATFGADGYQVYRAESKNGTYKKIGTVKNGKLTYTDKKAKKGKTYYYKVRAFWKSDKTYAGKFSSVVKKKR